ncbi:MAG: hypothetical protein RI601_08300 [Desulfurivibrionaceae bacterium]|nr:hypothetical protein [Desulfurivibrionaceae bacterium]
MNDDDNRLEKELAEVQRHFANHPSISIVATEGVPVTQYVVEYRLNGLVGLEGGEISRSDQHRVEITLSFGFPHFPPNCKPLTPIFHPDIDPAAIKIADFWKADESLVSLIVYIGQMICWQVYSEENVFNQEAASWLAAHSDGVPLDRVDLAGLPQGQERNGAVEQDRGEPQQEDFGLDLELGAESLSELAFETIDLGVLEEVSAQEPVPARAEEELHFAGEEHDAEPLPTFSDLEDVARDIDFGFNSPEMPTEEEVPSPIVVEEVDLDRNEELAVMAADEVEGEVDLDFATVDVDYDILCGMMAQGNFFAAQKKLNSMAPENLSEAAAGLHLEIENNIRDAEKIFQEATRLEGQGQLEEAARKFEGVLNAVRDYPALAENMKRVRNAWMAAMGEESGADADPLKYQEVSLGTSHADMEAPEEISLSLEKEDEDALVVAAGIPEPHFSDSLSAAPTGSASSTPPSGSGPSPRPKIQAKKASPLPKAPAKVVKSRKSLLVGGGLLFLVVALSGWFFMEWSAFNQAQQKWATIQPLLAKGQYEQVSQRCTEISQLLGRVHVVMVSGKKKILAQIEDIVSSDHFQEAIGGKVYYQAEYISPQAHAAYQEIGKLVAEGEKRGSLPDWSGALLSYEAALELAEKNRQRLDEDFYNQLLLKVKKAQFASHVAQGKRAFVAKGWLKAVDHFDQAMHLAASKEVADAAARHDVERYLQLARFSQVLVDGDALLQKGEWQEALINYQAAADLAQKGDIIGQGSRQAVSVKLQQISLLKGLAEGDTYTEAKKWAQAVAAYEKVGTDVPPEVTIPGHNIATTRERVAHSLLNALYHRDQEEARASFAKKEYDQAASALQRLILAIDSSSLKDKGKWQLIKKQAVDDQKKANLQGAIEAKIAYLQAHYADIFIENFVGVRAQVLDQPRIKFLEAKGTALVFSVRCRELRNQKYYTLELIYQYDMARNQWGFQGSS